MAQRPAPLTPEQFDAYKAAGEGFGIAHVESSPLTRSSYHARQSADAAGTGPAALVVEPSA